MTTGVLVSLSLCRTETAGGVSSDSWAVTELLNPGNMTKTAPIRMTTPMTANVLMSRLFTKLHLVACGDHASRTHLFSNSCTVIQRLPCISHAQACCWIDGTIVGLWRVRLLGVWHCGVRLSIGMGQVTMQYTGKCFKIAVRISATLHEIGVIPNHFDCAINSGGRLRMAE